MNPKIRLKNLAPIFGLCILTACSAGPQTSVGLYKIDETATGANTGLEAFSDRHGKPIFVKTPPVIDENCISKTGVQFDPQSHVPVIMIKLKSRCKETLGDFTRNNIGSQMAVIIDGKLTSIATINEEISGGSLIVPPGY